MPAPTVNEDLKTVAARVGQEDEITTITVTDTVGLFRGAAGSMTIGWASFLTLQNSFRAVTGVLAGLMSTTDKDKIDGIEDAATADQTGAEIKSAYEGEADTNAFTDAEQTKLAGVETAATADQTGAQIKTAYEAEADTNAFTDGRQTKLATIETAADVTDEGNVTAAFPVSDATALVKDPGDGTKRARFDVGAVATGTTRVVTLPNANINLTPAAGSFASAAQGATADAAQPGDATLTALAGLGTGADKVPYSVGADSFAQADLPAFGRSLIGGATAAAARTTLGLVPGTDVQVDLDVMAQAEAEAGTATTERVVHALVMKQSVLKHAPDATAVTPTDKSAGFTAANSDHGKTFRWTGTSAARLKVPDGLTVGTAFDVVADGWQGLADLSIQRPDTNAIIRLGEPIGRRVLAPGGRARIRVESAAKVRIEGDLVQATMDTFNGGASFLLERAQGLSATGGWLDQSGNGLDFSGVNTPISVNSNDGQLQCVLTGGDSGYVQSGSVTFAATDDTLFGLSAKIDSTDYNGDRISLAEFVDYTAGLGFWCEVQPTGIIALKAMVAAGADQAIDATLLVKEGTPFAVSAAIHHSATGGYIILFVSTATGLEQMEILTGLTFTAAWDGGAVPNFQVGPIFYSSLAMTADYYAATIRDGVSFANQADAADQAHALLGAMGDYYV